MVSNTFLDDKAYIKTESFASKYWGKTLYLNVKKKHAQEKCCGSRSVCFGTPGSESVSQRYESKNNKKNLDLTTTVL
jgi:hypothetical protein